MNITVYCGANAGKLSEYSQAASALGCWIAENGHTLIYGGGRIGLMGVVADAVLKGGGSVVGVIPEFLSTAEQRHTSVTKMYTVDTIGERKKKMLEMGDAFIALPGGTGTFEEIIEAISLHNLGRHDRPCVFFDVCGYYEPLRKMFDHMTQEGFLNGRARDTICFISSIGELENIIR